MRKGLPTLLEAYGQLRRARGDARLVIVGDGPMRWGYESQVAAMGIPDVEFAGRVSSEELPRYYASADIFCAPATGGESFGIVLLEAMASGCPGDGVVDPRVQQRGDARRRRCARSAAASQGVGGRARRSCSTIRRAVQR